MVGIGHDAVSRRQMTHLDSWIGGTAMPSSNTMVTGDVWTSGYYSADSISGGNIRLSLAIYQKAWMGMWIVRATGERLYNPDPDVFALSTIDAALRVLAPKSRVAERAVNVQLERSWRLNG